MTAALWSRRGLPLLAAVVVIAGCDSIDPTSQFFGVTFRNDTAHAVHLKLCSDSDCKHFDYSHGWKVGQSAKENISDRNLLTRWLVQDDVTGRVVGCLPLRFDQKYDQVVVRVSRAVSCPGTKALSVKKGEAQGRS